MADQPSLDGLARKTKRKRNAVSRVPASECAIAHVVLDVQAAHLGHTFDYLVSKEQDAAAQAGAFVRVRFGAQRLTGVIWSRSSHTDTPSSALRFIERVIPSDVLISKSLRDDIDAIAKAYGGTSANILRLAVPQRVARVENTKDCNIARLQSRKKWYLNLKKNFTSESNDSSHTTFPQMFESYENADILYKSLIRQNTSDFQSFVVDALPGSQRLAQDLAWMIVAAISAGRQVVAVLPTLREVNDVMRALMLYGLQPYKRVNNNYEDSSASNFDGDVARLSSADAPADRYRSWRAVASGIVPCVLGTRAAMYAPVEGDALFVIVEDCAYQYADGMMPYAQARGVMRLRAKRHKGTFVSMAYSRSALSQSEVDFSNSNNLLEKSSAETSAETPAATSAETYKSLKKSSKESQESQESCESCESYKSCESLVSGSSIAVTPIPSVRKQIMPWVRYLNREALLKLADQSIGSRIPHTAVRAINEALGEAKPVLLSIPQDGVTQSAVCVSCSQQARCRRCTGPIDVAGGKDAAHCIWCGASAVSWSCSNCGSTGMRVIRVGAAGTAEELAKLFRNVPILLSSPHQPNGIIECIDENPVIVVATPGSEPRVKSKDGSQNGEYGVVAILDAWVSLYASGLDTRIDTLTAWMKAASLCAPKTRGGSVLVIGETYPILAKSLTLWDASQLSLNELLERKQAVLPPCVTAACVWGSRDAVIRALRNIGAIPKDESNQNKNASKSDDLFNSHNLPMLTIPNNPADTNKSNQKSETNMIPPLLGVVSMHSKVTDHYQHFDEFDDRVKAVVRVPLSWRQELVDRLQKQIAHHAATREAGELRFCIDPKDLLAY
ncbi:primosomal protein N' [Gardnerella vaginalis]|uniref:primosomal protein N' n=1 Tax=Gardnerella vaginalis TaxID=2702 RepID=UPI0039EEBBA5